METGVEKKNPEPYAPFWLAMTIFDSPYHSQQIENFMDAAPKGVHGRLVVRNETTKDYCVCADRYGSTVLFLASRWMIPEYTYHLVADHAGNVVIDTSVIERMSPPEQFIHARAIGETQWNEHKERIRRAAKHGNAPEPKGRFELVWVPEE